VKPRGDSEIFSGTELLHPSFMAASCSENDFFDG